MFSRLHKKTQLARRMAGQRNRHQAVVTKEIEAGGKGRIPARQGL